MPPNYLGVAVQYWLALTRCRPWRVFDLLEAKPSPRPRCSVFTPHGELRSRRRERLSPQSDYICLVPSRHSLVLRSDTRVGQGFGAAREEVVDFRRRRHGLE